MMVNLSQSMPNVSAIFFIGWTRIYCFFIKNTDLYPEICPVGSPPGLHAVKILKELSQPFLLSTIQLIIQVMGEVGMQIKDRIWIFGDDLVDRLQARPVCRIELPDKAGLQPLVAD